MVFVEAIIFVASLVLLIIGSDYFVKSASEIAKRFGVSEFIIGLTVVAIGTSLPELASSIAAAATAHTAIVVGNVVGSNIANIGLVAGAAGSLVIMKTHKQMLMRDGYIMILVTLLWYLFAFGGTITMWESLILLILYIAYILFVMETHANDAGRVKHTGEFFLYFLQFRYLDTAYKHIKRSLKTKKHVPNDPSVFEKNTFLGDIAILIISIIAITAGAHFLVEETIFFAQLLNIPEALISITAISIGTSLPELAVTIAAAHRKMGDIALGNIIGSNIANICLVIGVSGLIRPLTVSANMMTFAAPYMIGMMLVGLLFIRTRWQIQRAEGISLLVLYGIFIAILIARPALSW